MIASQVRHRDCFDLTKGLDPWHVGLAVKDSENVGWQDRGAFRIAQVRSGSPDHHGVVSVAAS